ncbi:MAG: YraN family protein [Agarilytica sp.]
MIFRTNKNKIKSSGEQAEDLALEYLEQNKLRTLTRNYRCKLGEIDLIMKDAETLVFVEVRYRKNDHFGSALDSVDNRKQNKVLKAAQCYMSENKTSPEQAIRFDVIGITGSETQWIKNAF